MIPPESNKWPEPLPVVPAPAVVETGDPDEATCPECKGRTIEFAGIGLNMQYRICSRWRPGSIAHLSETEINERLYRVTRAVRPSGRFA